MQLQKDMKKVGEFTLKFRQLKLELKPWRLGSRVGAGAGAGLIP